MNFRKLLTALLVVTLLCFNIGCSSSAEKTDGISGEPGNYSYRVRLGSADIEDIFSFVGTPNKVASAIYGDPSASIKVASYCQVREGGWVAYTSSQFVYLPNGTKESAKSACTGLRLNPDTEDIMSYQEFTEYFDFSK